MLHSLMLFLAPAATPAQAIPISPPAVAPPAAVRPAGRTVSCRFVARVIGDAIGFAVLFAGCWFCLSLLAAVL